MGSSGDAGKVYKRSEVESRNAFESSAGWSSVNKNATDGGKKGRAVRKITTERSDDGRRRVSVLHKWFLSKRV